MAARYNSIAISLHWLIAVMIAGLVIIAKIAHSMADDNPLRFELIQWHKSFGVALLFLVAFRIIWRLMHRPPALPASMKKLERFAASAAHLVLYALMIAMPLTGWAMVSASPMNLATELFGLIPWPHLPWLTEITDRDVWEFRFHKVHHLLGNGLMLVVAVHVLAALRHQFFLKDGVLSRMAIGGDSDNRYAILLGALIAVAGTIGLVNLVDQNRFIERSTAAAAGNPEAATVVASRVGFIASQSGDPINGVFHSQQITLILDDANLSDASLNASVQTGSVDSGDGQIDATVVTADWFASARYPDAVFESAGIESVAAGQYRVYGALTIRDVSNNLEFVMQREGNQFRGQFTIDRTDYGVGVGGQDEFVAPEVTIYFEVAL